MKKYLWNIVVLIDQALNTVFGPLLNVLFGVKEHRFGDPDETLSSVLGKNVQDGECVGCKFICRVLNWLDPNHCAENIETDRGDRA